MSESTYQRKIIKQYKADGWKYIRLLQTTENGIADTLMLKRSDMPGYVKALFIEFKAKGKKADPLQEFRHRQIERETGIQTIVMIEP
jgi:hypothetical protein